MKLYTFEKNTTKDSYKNYNSNDDFLLYLINQKEQDTELEEKTFTNITVEVEDDKKYNIYQKRLLDINSKMIDFFIEYNFTEETKTNFYKRFSIPKRHGGIRKLIDPNPELKRVQREVLDYLQNTLGIKHHNVAHAFTPHRDAYTNAIQHKDSTCIIELDIKDFFTNITTETLRKELNRNFLIYKCNEICPDFISNICRLATLDGCLPQGSPLSPFLTNVVMCYFDYKVCKCMREGTLARYRYTRYADDMCFSSKAFSHIKTFLDKINELLKEIAPELELKKEKTKLLTVNNKCYITGVKINYKHEATYGHEHKRDLKLELYNLFKSYENNNTCKEEVQEILGKFSYMKRIEPKYANYLEKKLLKQFNSREGTLTQHFKQLL